MSTLSGDPVAAQATKVRLRDVDPDFLRFVPGDERHMASEVVLPAIDLDPGPFDPQELLITGGAACGVVIAGMVDRHIHVADHVALRLLGPGSIIADRGGGSPEVITSSNWTAAAPVRLALLGTQFLRASARWPQLQRNMISRFADQNEQLAAQLALCQMPRVEDRLLTMLWLLAESWGRVTSAGTLLPVRITHEALGAMVGARRPTVTLALTELANAGAVLQRPSGWLLLRPAPEQSTEAPRIESPQLLELEPTAWARAPVTTVGDAETRQRELLKLIPQLRDEHERSVTELQERLRQAQLIRERAYELRDRLREERRTGVGRPPRRPTTDSKI